MRLVLFLLVLACALRAESIPITGSINQSFPGTENTTITGPGLSFQIQDEQSCLLCGDPQVGHCLPGTICGFNYTDSLFADTASFERPAVVTYHGIVFGSGMPGSVSASFNLPTSPELFTGQFPLIEPVTVSGELQASMGNQRFLDLFVSGSGTAQILIDPISPDTINDPYHVFGIDINFTGTASTSAVPEPKNVGLVLLSLAGVLGLLKTRWRILR
jgi:hypothetical protein